MIVWRSRRSTKTTIYRWNMMQLNKKRGFSKQQGKKMQPSATLPKNKCIIRFPTTSCQEYMVAQQQVSTKKITILMNSNMLSKLTIYLKFWVDLSPPMRKFWNKKNASKESLNSLSLNLSSECQNSPEEDKKKQGKKKRKGDSTKVMNIDLPIFYMSTPQISNLVPLPNTFLKI